MIINIDDYELKMLVGKTVVDSYGWIIGKIMGFSVDSNETISEFGIERSNGRFMKCEKSELHFDQNYVVFNNSWRKKAERLTDEIILTVKRLFALDKLKENEEVEKEIYVKLHTEIENNKKRLLEHRRHLSDKLKERLTTIDPELGEVYKFLIGIKINYNIKKMSEELYQKSNLIFQNTINRLLLEKDDINFALKKVSNNLLTLPPEPLKPLHHLNVFSSPIKLKLKQE